MEHFKRSTARDFRINGATLEAALRQESSDEEEENNVYIYTTYFLQWSFFFFVEVFITMIDSSRF